MRSHYWLDPGLPVRKTLAGYRAVGLNRFSEEGELQTTVSDAHPCPASRLTFGTPSLGTEEGRCPLRPRDMEDTLTCSKATFSQVFGRQGQLMQSSEYPQPPLQAPNLHKLRFFIWRLLKEKVFIKDSYQIYRVFSVGILPGVCRCSYMLSKSAKRHNKCSRNVQFSCFFYTEFCWLMCVSLPRVL